MGITATRPSPIQTGVLKLYTKFHKVKEGDTYYNIANNNKIMLNTFYKWNPTIKIDYSALKLRIYIYISLS
jgi:LysM repeat protein